MTEHELLAAKLENAKDISLHVWDPIHSWSEEVSLTGEEQSAIVAALREIERLQNAKRAALKLADERAKEANGMRAALKEARRYCDERIGPSRASLLDKIANVIDAALTDEEGKS